MFPYLSKPTRIVITTAHYLKHGGAHSAPQTL